MFKKILIANRGEIACRVIKTAKKMGIGTVAVFSEADRDALHVKLADEAVYIGPSPAAESYLVQENIIRACKETGAEAVHPGYGFLSENSSFCNALEAEGIVFIGPGTRAIEAMGDKIASKKLAEEAGVNVIPGVDGVIEDAEHAVKAANSIGYPVMLKASAGGGGKGMRIVRDDDECREGFERASNEARSSFGDDRMLVEKYIEQPRHIEIQVIADAHGTTLYLNERECSLQRRHQKVIEESPSPFLDEATRREMGTQAVALARAVEYRSAGTVEFIVDAERNFYFLEMNTRLQVEHPVTELTTGLDLVELMLRVAAGEKLALTQDEVGINGWSIEARVYAEDPLRNFLPSTGRLVHFQPPPEDENVRVDTGVYEGGEVSMYYDPMIAKLITHGASREEAMMRMCAALDRFLIRGVASNLSFLSALMVHPRYVTGDISTDMIGVEYPDGFSASDRPEEDPYIIVCVAAYVFRRYRDRAAGITGQLKGHERRTPTDYVVVLDREHYPVSVVTDNGGCIVEYAGERHEVRTSWRFGQKVFDGAIDGKQVYVRVERNLQNYRLVHGGYQANIRMLTPEAARLLRHIPEKTRKDSSKVLFAPMPGKLVSLAVGEGDEVSAGSALAVLEAMKMENTLRAEHDGTVAHIFCEAGANLEVGDKILELK